jgi:2-oxoisovalerate dehydrogenase E2 component (dihydrolipoyl transacylase)
MELFLLPDLGEGLPDAEIHEWFVKEGDIVRADQPLVSMETAKAVVEVPSPQDGVIIKCYGKNGDIIKTGEPLVAFSEGKSPKADKGTVVGKLEESNIITADNFTIGTASSGSSRPKATPTVRMLAKKLGCDIQQIKGTGEFGVITRADVQQEADKRAKPPEGYEALHGVRRTMLMHMVQSHKEVVPVTIFDEADIHHWRENTDITVRLIRAIIFATAKEPALNAWFDTSHNARKLCPSVHLGLAMDNDEGLFVPVIHDASTLSDIELRSTINSLKKSVQDRTVPSEQLKGATITLSNFGKFAGKFASPIIVPPMVAILAVGRRYEAAVSCQGEIKAHHLLPLSLSFDHRAVTGGEATRFLGAVIESLQEK